MWQVVAGVNHIFTLETKDASGNTHTFDVTVWEKLPGQQSNGPYEMTSFKSAAGPVAEVGGQGVGGRCCQQCPPGCWRLACVQVAAGLHALPCPCPPCAAAGSRRPTPPPQLRQQAPHAAAPPTRPPAPATQ